MGANKNMVRGTIFAGIYVLITIVIPYMTFSWISQLTVQEMNLTMEKEKITNIYFWILAFGFLISGTAFFAYSSPSQSIRRGVFCLIQIFLNCLYIWSYKFSGATEIEFILVDLGTMSIDLSQMIMVILGIYFLTIILKTYDLVDFIVNRNKIREKRRRGE